TTRSHFQNRLVLVAESTQDAIKKLSNYQKTSPPSPLLIKERGEREIGLLKGTITTSKRPKIAFLFAGEDSTLMNLGWELYQTQ
ncbi:MAG: hypothetical protein AAF063_37180, partial [Cyanobacteria bacterium J06643_5]